MKKTMVVLNDLDLDLRRIRDLLENMPETKDIDYATFRSDDDANHFVRKYSQNIVAFIQDIVRPDFVTGHRGLHQGIRFYNDVIYPFTPHAKTLFYSCLVDAAERRIIPDNDQVSFLENIYDLSIYPEGSHALSLHNDEFRQKVIWLLGLSKDTAKNKIDTEHSQTIQLIELVAPPWKEICRYIDRHPSYLHSMDHRKFENLVAEIYKDNGWEVELTALTKDGGYDIIAIKRDNPTNLKALIEAKRYAPNRPVGVSIIRSLYGIRLLNSASQVVLATSSFVTDDAKREFSRAVPWELDFLERDKILEWCSNQGSVELGGSFDEKV